MNSSNQEIVQSIKKIAGKKFTWFALLMVSLTFTAFNTRPDASPSPFDKEAVAVSPEAEEHMIVAGPSATSTSEADQDPEMVLPEIERLSAQYNPENSTERLAVKKLPVKASASPEGLTDYAQSLLGKPYNYGGITPKGFDCSGFVYHVFQKFDREILRSSRDQSTQGTEVDVQQAAPGDLIFFTGTNARVREVGHVGIIISSPGEPVSFVHSSSNGGVKISELEGYYSTRFMFAKRMD